MATIMNFVNVIGVILVFCLCVLGGFTVYSLIRMNAKEEKNKPVQKYSSPYPFYTQSLYSKNNDNNPEIYKIEQRINKLTEAIQNIETLLDIVSTSPEFEESFDKTIPEQIQEIRDIAEKCKTCKNFEYEIQVKDIKDVYDTTQPDGTIRSIPKNTEYKITIGDDPNQMSSGTTVQL